MMHELGPVLPGSVSVALRPHDRSVKSVFATRSSGRYVSVWELSDDGQTVAWIKLENSFNAA